MPRDISSDVPDYIAELIYSNWGDMKSFSVAIGLPYTSVYSILMKRNLRAAHTLIELAKPLGISPEELGRILVISDVQFRKEKIDSLLAGKSLRQWAIEAGKYAGSIVKVIYNLEQFQINNMLTITSALNITIVDFLQHFECSSKAS